MNLFLVPFKKKIGVYSSETRTIYKTAGADKLLSAFNFQQTRKGIVSSVW